MVPVVQTDCEPDDYDAFVKAVLDEIDAEQRVEEDSESDSDIEVVNEPPVILLNQACEKMRELMVFLSLALTSDKTKLMGALVRAVSNAWQASGPAHNVQGATA